MLRDRVNRYVDRVVAYLPRLERNRARRIITETIYARLQEATFGTKPTAFDVRLLFKELGSPRELAQAYRRDFYEPWYKKLGKHTDLWRGLHKVMLVLSVMAFVLVCAGMAQLLLGIGDLKGLAVGLGFAVIVVLYQMLIQPMEPILSGR